jgi:ABC-type transporter Mla MlaB component
MSVVNDVVKNGHSDCGLVRLSGHVTFKDGCELWRTQHPDYWSHRVYYVDLSRVTSFSENGIAWLRIFLRWAETAGFDVRLVNATASVQANLLAAGLQTHQTDGGDGGRSDP